MHLKIVGIIEFRKYDNKIWLTLRLHFFLGSYPFRNTESFLNIWFYTWYLFPFFVCFLKLKTTIGSTWYNQKHTIDLLFRVEFQIIFLFLPMGNKYKAFYLYILWAGTCLNAHPWKSYKYIFLVISNKLLKSKNAWLLSAFSVLIERRNETRIGAVEEH